MTILAYGFAVVLLVAGSYHFVNPQFYFGIMPDWFHKPLANAAGGAAEILVGAAMLFPATRVPGLYAAAVLMILFLPIHLIDLTRARPVIGSKTVAVVRLIIQFFLIGWLLWEARAGARVH